MIIFLPRADGRSDYGPSVKITEPWDWLCQPDDNYNYFKSPEGVFRRSVNYWDGSPFGWQCVLPNHMDKWGMQT